MNAMLRMSASLEAAPEWHLRQVNLWHRLKPDGRCKWPMIDSRFLAVASAFGPSIRIKFFGSVPVTSASRPNPTVALM